MTMDLYSVLIEDISSLGIATDFKLELKSYSKSYLGRYVVKSSKIQVYIYENKSCTVIRPYKEILNTVIHEAIHHIQHKNPDFKRIKGVMHDEEFYKLHEQYKSLALAKGLTERRCFIFENEVKIESL